MQISLFRLIPVCLFWVSTLLPLNATAVQTTLQTSAKAVPLPSVVSAVVNIKVERPKQLTEEPTAGHDPQQPPFTESIGSGFFISTNGLIVTNAHVVAGASNIIVSNEDGNDSIGRIVGIDPIMDLAVVQTSFNPSYIISLDTIAKASVGEPVYAVGNAFGLAHSVSYGIISALHRSVSHPIQDFIQTDSAINQGNSGGPLVNKDGHLIGVNTMIMAVTGGNNGVGFAIPSSIVSNIAKQIIQHNSVQPGQIGVTIQNLPTDMAKALGAPNAKGVVVTDIVPKSTAEQLSLQEEDIIVAINNEPIISSSQAAAQVYSLRVGEPISVSIIRKGRAQTLTAEIQAPVNQDQIDYSTAPILSGIALTEFNSIDTRGVQQIGLGVVKVTPGSPGWLAGIKPLDLITKIGKKQMQKLSDINHINIQGPTLIEVMRQNKRLFLVLAPARSALPEV